MKKKTMVLAYLLILSLGTILSLYIPKNEVAAKDAIVIPGQAIRLRILANSDLDSDQALKRKVRDAVNAKISVWVKDLTSIQKAREVIKSKLPEIQATAEEVVKEEGSKQSVDVKFGKVQFPTKLYGQFLYPAGKYEAILITLGAGKGANWWCVLFPPLCFLDFSNGIAVSEGFDGEKEAKAASKPEDRPTEKQAKSEERVKQVVAVASKEEVQADSKKAQEVPPTESKKEVKAQEVTPADSKKDVQVQDSKQTHVASKTQSKAIGSAKPEKKVLNRAEKEMQTDEESEQYASVQVASAKTETSVKEEAPVYTSQDEETVKVKFFVVELWNKIF